MIQNSQENGRGLGHADPFNQTVFMFCCRIQTHLNKALCFFVCVSPEKLIVSLEEIQERSHQAGLVGKNIIDVKERFISKEEFINN
ncbi:MAG TPA: hypothetical protein VEP29_05120, partial [Desulfatiglandales bacterium]|nr:hypothetical protein [Desulfatiglandales bacterium]